MSFRRAARTAHRTQTAQAVQQAGVRGENVVDLAAAVRARAERTEPTERKAPAGRTIILSATIEQAAATVYRQIGVNAALHLTDLHRIIDTCFGFDALGLAAAPASPHWEFRSAVGRRLPGSTVLDEALGRPGSRAAYSWGLWRVDLVTAEAYRRDAQTPQALCVGGTGTLADLGPVGEAISGEFDLAFINAQLTGTRTIHKVLAATRPEVREIISRSGLFNFVPLLQAMDLRGEVDLAPATRRRLAGLPLEADARGRDAFWSVVLGLSCLADEALADVAATTMAALGWTAGPGNGAHLERDLSAEEVFDAARASLTELAELGCFGGFGAGTLAPVDRLQVYRALLRAPAGAGEGHPPVR